MITYTGEQAHIEVRVHDVVRRYWSCFGWLDGEVTEVDTSDEARPMVRSVFEGGAKTLSGQTAEGLIFVRRGASRTAQEQAAPCAAAP